jgi:hypothetical protein
MSILKNILEIAKISKPAKTRSSQWTKVRAQHLKDHPVCAVCGETKKVEVHHIMPFSDDPALELEPTNLITLCELASDGIICHLAIGHCGNYRRYNPNVLTDAVYFKQMFANRKD